MGRSQLRSQGCQAVGLGAIHRLERRQEPALDLRFCERNQDIAAVVTRLLQSLEPLTLVVRIAREYNCRGVGDQASHNQEGAAPSLRVHRARGATEVSMRADIVLLGERPNAFPGQMRLIVVDARPRAQAIQVGRTKLGAGANLAIRQRAHYAIVAGTLADEDNLGRSPVNHASRSSFL
jgi:hypothetical protein